MWIRYYVKNKKLVYGHKKNKKLLAFHGRLLHNYSFLWALFSLIKQIVLIHWVSTTWNYRGTFRYGWIISNFITFNKKKCNLLFLFLFNKNGTLCLLHAKDGYLTFGNVTVKNWNFFFLFLELIFYLSQLGNELTAILTYLTALNKKKVICIRRKK